MNSRERWHNRAKRLNKGREEKVSVEDLKAVTAIWGEECFYCRKALDFDSPDSGATFDHLVPYSRGGRNVKRNLVPACDGCNGRKDEKRLRWNGRSKKLEFTWDGVKVSEGQSSHIARKRRAYG